MLGATILLRANPARGAQAEPMGRRWARCIRAFELGAGAHRQPPGKSYAVAACREVFARGQRKVEVEGPLLEDEGAAEVIRGFWGIGRGPQTRQAAREPFSKRAKSPSGTATSRQ